MTNFMIPSINVNITTRNILPKPHMNRLSG